MKSDNPFVDFYKSNNISPVHQDISNIETHIRKREKLYRTLGLCPVFFKNKEILEVGPGGGYNSLAFFVWGCSSMVFVEPNPQGCKEIPKTLSRINITDRYKIFPCLLEDFNIDNRFDIIVAEGFIPGLYDRTEVISKLKGLVSNGGVIVVTCMDEISYFFDHLKRLVASKYLYDHQITEFSEKVKHLSKIFLPFHRALKFASRPIEDWVADVLLNPSMYGKYFSIEDGILEFGNEFEVLGTCPSMFTNYSWHKDISFNEKEEYLKQFKLKRHNLMYSHLADSLRSQYENEELLKLCKDLFSDASKIKSFDIKTSKNLVEILNLIRKNVWNMDPNIVKAIEESISLIKKRIVKAEDIQNSSNLGKVYGTGQQYIALVKKFV